MKQEDLFRKLGLILNELNDQYAFLAQNPQQLSELELELFQANANFLVDHVQIIKKINVPPTLALPVAEKEEPAIDPDYCEEKEEIQEESQVEAVAFSAPEIEEDPVEEDVEHQQDTEAFENPEILEKEIFTIDQSPSTFEFILNDHSAEDKFDFEEKTVDELFNRPLSEEEEQILAQKMKLREQTAIEMDNDEEDEIGPEPFLVTSRSEPLTPQEEFLADQTEQERDTAPTESEEEMPAGPEPVEDADYRPTLNELFAKNNASHLHETTRTPIKDLKQAINLNDKLLYIKDLFNGYNLAYAEAIDIANKLSNFEAADNFFQKNYAAKNNWAEKQATVDKFYQVLNERFK